jgi:hypothetical protein
MNKQYTYKAFGLIINSTFPINEFIVSEGIPDVKIKTGSVPEQLNHVAKKGVKYQATKNEFLLEVDTIARYYVKDGCEITIEPLKSKVDNEIRLFLLGSVLGALFLQRGLLPIHGSSIKFGNTACVFSGISGVGKSSLAACFVKKGFSFLADDISVVDNNLMVIPSFPNIKLWKDVLNKLEINEASLNKIRPELKKYQLPLEDKYFKEPLPLDKFFIISTKNTPGFEYAEIKGLQKFDAVKSNTYRFRFVEGLQQQQDHFLLLNKLLPNIKVYMISRPQSPILLNEFADFIIDTFNLHE